MKLYYQPYPFKDLKVKHTCKDCDKRYQAIKDNFGDYKNRTMLDLYSANCYFGFRFLQDGGIWVEAVDRSEEIRAEVNGIAHLRDLPLICHLFDEEIIEPRFDIGLLLDSFGYGNTERDLDLLKDKCEVSFVSAPDKRMNEMLARELGARKFVISPIYQGKDGKIIYKCHL